MPIPQRSLKSFINAELKEVKPILKFDDEEGVRSTKSS